MEQSTINNTLQMQPDALEPTYKLELFFACRDLVPRKSSSFHPYVVVYVKKAGNWAEHTRTETVRNDTNPNFVRSMVIDFFFETEQRLRLQIYDEQKDADPKLVGTCETTVGDIIDARMRALLVPLIGTKGRNKGQVLVRADYVEPCNEDIYMVLSIDSNQPQGASYVQPTKFLFWQQISPFLRIYRARKDDPKAVLVLQSNHLPNTPTPKWEPLRIKAQKLCNGDYKMPLRVEIWDYKSDGKHEYLGGSWFTIGELNRAQPKRQLDLLDQKNTSCGMILVNEFRCSEKPSFFDYIDGGIQLEMAMAIDFSASNGRSDDYTAHHFNNPDDLNLYQLAILGVGEILMNCDYEKQIAAYGFGCKTAIPRDQPNMQSYHIFPLNGKPQEPIVIGLHGIMDAYSDTLSHSQFEEPTFFGPILRNAIKQATVWKESNSDNYLIKLIFTDGEIHDMQDAIDSVIAASSLPISIIIVGIGCADFAKMETLCNRDLQLKNSKGHVAQRQLVQFVQFTSFQNNPDMLAKKVLEDLPNQLVNYMQLIGRQPFKPENIEDTDIQQPRLGIQNRIQNQIDVSEYGKQQQQGMVYQVNDDDVQDSIQIVQTPKPKKIQVGVKALVNLAKKGVLNNIGLKSKNKVVFEDNPKEEFEMQQPRRPQQNFLQEL